MFAFEHGHTTIDDKTKIVVILKFYLQDAASFCCFIVLITYLSI